MLSGLGLLEVHRPNNVITSTRVIPQTLTDPFKKQLPIDLGL